jgi:putative two-component system response regulator
MQVLSRVANTAAVAMTNVELVAQLDAARQEAVRAKDAIIFAMASLAEVRDNETGNHIYRTQHYVRALAIAARRSYRELDDEAVELLFKTAPLHDIGKVGIPDRILLKPGKLTPEEYEIMKGHADLGRSAIETAENALGPSLFLRYAREIAHTHHERWDGTGYPQGLAGEDIPLAGRIMAIADVYDAIVSRRVYKPAMMHEAAVKIIAEESGRHFDPQLVTAFLGIADEFDEIHQQFAEP